MDGVIVLDLVLGVVVMIVIVPRVGFRRVRRGCRALAGAVGVPRPRSEAVVPEGEALEAALAARVVHGQVSRGAYQHRMAELAAADDARRPLPLPPV